MHIISFSQATIKVLLAGLTRCGVLGFLCTIVCCSPQDSMFLPEVEVSKEELKLRPEEGKWYHEEAPFSGYATVYHPNGKMAEKVGFYEGKKQGLARKWYVGGSIRYEANFVLNRLDGMARAWTLEGVLVKESHYIQGKTHGLQKTWYPSGMPFKWTHFEMGKEAGIQRAWRENGAIFINYEAKNGRFFGLKRANACYELKEEVIQF